MENIVIRKITCDEVESAMSLALEVFMQFEAPDYPSEGVDTLTEVQVLPHYSKYLTRFAQFEEKCCIYEKEHHVNVIRLNDGDGVFIDGDVHISKTDFNGVQ